MGRVFINGIEWDDSFDLQITVPETWDAVNLDRKLDPVSVVASGELTGPTVQAQLAQVATLLADRLQSSPDFLADHLVVYDDFLNDGITSGAIGSLGWTLTTAGAGAAAIAANDQGAPGVLTLQGTNSPDSASIGLNAFSVIGSPEMTMEWRAKPNNLNGGGNDATYKLGSMDAGGTSSNNGIWFEYAAALGANWFTKTRAAAGAVVQTNTGVPVTTDWTRFRYICDGNSTVYFYIDGVLVATHATGLPTTQPHTPRAFNIKTAGATARNFRLDYFYLKMARP